MKGSWCNCMPKLTLYFQSLEQEPDRHHAMVLRSIMTIGNPKVIPLWLTQYICIFCYLNSKDHQKTIRKAFVDTYQFCGSTFGPWLPLDSSLCPEWLHFFNTCLLFYSQENAAFVRFFRESVSHWVGYTWRKKRKQRICGVPQPESRYSHFIFMY